MTITQFNNAENQAAQALDVAPEFFHYEDTGCEASSSCLDCPLPQCRYDDPIWYQRNRRLAKDFRVLATMQAENLSVEAAAERFDVTARTIFRILRRCKNATSGGPGYAAAVGYGQRQPALAA